MVSFFDMMEEAISGIESTVAVTSRSEYSLPSAGATCVALADEAQPISCKLRPELVERQVGAHTGNGLQLVQRAAGVSQRAAGHLGDDHARRRGQRRRDQAGLVAHAAGGMLVHLYPGIDDRSTVSPDRTMLSVKALTSRSVIPEK